MILLGSRLEAPEDDHHDDSDDDDDDDDDLPPSLSPDIGPRHQPSPPLALAAPQHRSVLWPVASTKAQCLHFSLSLSRTVLPLMRFIDTSFSRNGMEVEKDVFARTI